MRKLFKDSKPKKPAPAFPWPDHRIREHVETSVESLSAPSNPSPDTKEPREKESALDVLGNFLFGARDVSRPWSERDHDKDRQRQDRFVEPPDITQMIGRLTATASEDWTVVLELCEHVSANEAAAKEAAEPCGANSNMPTLLPN
ncbi:hypothetical protein BS47DRAFT_1389940 [Hydnum rufescens UP504]|uniref:VHS domain-containing protein n=1 Tax=Hydnum rufescens UP504 TaxID=1448309 RepID=A0A9P6B4T7_9AGAM|nr:hypothetical protein BS47DRAFT_1389940 [Hydnum rufescens UP504]